MTQKSNDDQGRFRSKTYGFRLSPEENDVLNRKVALSGMSKQDYLIAHLVNEEIVVEGNPYVYRSLKNELNHFTETMKETKDLQELELDELEVLEYVLKLVIAMKHKKRAQFKTDMEPRQ
ncbi:plasmid mobilization protein [Longibaculum muris]|uniref:Mobilization protein n=1 Tax=Longibaculum muris TaxID=1796628 RepID=A0A4R3ZC00_9FIRM|nr:hypothetical protein [Longibaculum muris]KXU40739.1 hypothetical protein HMPREF3037_03249 [Candidatus Stoquefichus sp. KLE1796]MCR1886965.1 hypothetical protein [Longibaculum muris]TCW02996.1 hypothetical protein EDD60_101302 [Longibaculum muris]